MIKIYGTMQTLLFQSIRNCIGVLNICVLLELWKTICRQYLNGIRLGVIEVRVINVQRSMDICLH